MMRWCALFSVVVCIGMVVLATPLTVWGQSKKDADAAQARGKELHQEGRFREAKPELEKALRLFEQVEGKNHADVANILIDLGNLYRDMGEYGNAEPSYLRGAQIYELANNQSKFANSLNSLAGLYLTMGQYGKAEPLFQRSLQIREAQLGKKHTSVAASLNDLGLLYRTVGQYAKAEPLLQRSLQIYQEKLGQNHLSVATTQNNLALLYRDTGRFAESEPLFKRSLEICEEKLAKNHPTVATSHFNLANLYRYMGQYAKAEQHYQRCLQIREEQLGKSHPLVARCLNSMGVARAMQQQWAAAADLHDRARRIQQVHVQEMLPLFNDQEQHLYLKGRQGETEGFHLALSLGLKNPADPALAVLSASWVLNGKALTEEVAAQRVRLLSAQRGNKLVKELLDVRRQLAQVVLAPGNSQTAKKQREDLQKREADLLKQLAKTGTALQPTPWVEATSVRKVLAKDQVLVEIVRFDYPNFAAQRADKSWLGQRYAAWIIPPAGKGIIHVVDLGEATAIDAAVKAVLVEIQRTPGPQGTLLTKGEPEAEKILKKPLKKLSDLVLAPLHKHIGTSPRWTLSPDGSLWLLPWEMLLLPDGRYAVEEHRIHYVNSGRYLTLKAKAGATATQPCIFADPDFDLEPGKAKMISQKLKADDAPIGELRKASPSLTGILGNVKRLPGTAAEAALIAQTLERYAGMKPKLYTDQEALKSVFLRMARPKVLVLSTHGFFLPAEAPDPAFKDKRIDLDSGQQGKAPENALLRCGLLLAGANHFKKAAGENDGIVTGMDVLNTDLRGTDLVVLSACETGLGDVRNGEGVAGMRQAFQLAGARAVVSSLWNVSDRETALLMKELFDNLAKGQSKTEALRAAQLARIAKRRTEFAAAHPFYWAAFTLTGMSEAAK